METGSDLGFEITTGELNLTLDCEHAHVSGHPPPPPVALNCPLAPTLPVGASHKNHHPGADGAVPPPPRGGGRERSEPEGAGDVRGARRRRGTADPHRRGGG